MLTNLLYQIIVSLVTNTVENVTEWDHMEPVPCDCKRPAFDGTFGTLGGYITWGCTVGHVKGVGPRKKERVTTVKEVSTLSFDWSGSARSVVSERTVSETREAFALEWNRAELKKPDWNTNGEINFLRSGLVTNVIWLGGKTNVGVTITNYNTTGTNVVYDGMVTNRSKITSIRTLSNGAIIVE